jgi:membrane associated rhomboid family serine protease
MTMAPVGIRCPEHSGRRQGVERVSHGVRRASFEGVGAKVTRALIGINVAVYIAELATGGGVDGIGSTIYEKGVLIASAVDPSGHLIGVAHGEWWRLITAAFLHYGPFHLLLNMLALYWFGSLLEQRIGSGRFLLLYLVSGLAGSAGALLWSPLVPTVGASGAIFGILGAGLVLEQQLHLHVLDLEHLEGRPHRRAARRDHLRARPHPLRPRPCRLWTRGRPGYRDDRGGRDRRRRDRVLEGQGLRVGQESVRAASA